jgi:hypothetical protein
VLAAVRSLLKVVICLRAMIMMLGGYLIPLDARLHGRITGAQQAQLS